MRFFIILLLAFVAHASAETVYKTVDEHGNVIYTDKPSQEAEKIQIDELKTIKNPYADKYIYKPYTPKKEPEKKYDSLSITSPADDEAIRSNTGDVTITIAVKPGLGSDDQLQLLLDGKQVASGNGNRFALKNIDRGTHTVVVQVVDTDGKVIISSPSQQFHLLRR